MFVLLLCVKEWLLLRRERLQPFLENQAQVAGGHDRRVDSHHPARELQLAINLTDKIGAPGREVDDRLGRPHKAEQYVRLCLLRALFVGGRHP